MSRKLHHPTVYRKKVSKRKFIFTCPKCGDELTNKDVQDMRRRYNRIDMDINLVDVDEKGDTIPRKEEVEEYEDEEVCA